MSTSEISTVFVKQMKNGKAYLSAAKITCIHAANSFLIANTRSKTHSCNENREADADTISFTTLLTRTILPSTRSRTNLPAHCSADVAGRQLSHLHVRVRKNPEQPCGALLHVAGAVEDRVSHRQHTCQRKEGDEQKLFPDQRVVTNNSTFRDRI